MSTVARRSREQNIGQDTNFTPFENVENPRIPKRGSELTQLGRPVS